MGHDVSWIRKNAEPIEAIGAIIGAIATVIGVLAIGYQLNYSDRQQALQSAREGYQNHLNQSLAFPQYAAPPNACELLHPNVDPSYATFVDQLIYTAEAMLAAESGWRNTFLERLEPHRRYICLEGNALADTRKVKDLLDQFTAENCPVTPACHVD